VSEQDRQAERILVVRLPAGIATFAVKTCFIAAVISVCSIVVVNWVVATVEDSVTRTVSQVRTQLAQTPIGGERFWTKIEHELDRAADPRSDLPPEEKQKLINNLRIITARWRPVIDAVRSEMQKSPAAQ
jgi:hypothetical protein